jgi:tRNA (cmo5U34)-methyltransferase
MISQLIDEKDCLYADPLPRVGDFTFDESVARVFPDMIHRSVPGYADLVAMIGVLAADILRRGGRCYDLGCSLGAVSYAVSGAARADNIWIVAVDNSPAMIERLRQRLNSHPPAQPISLCCADIEDVGIVEATLVVLNLTLQFLSVPRRFPLLQKICQGLQPGGVLILTEKLAFDPAEQRAMDALHQAFKRAQGYSEMEISQKRTALERVLVPESLQAHQARLRAAGFSKVMVWFQCLNFVSLLAWK